MFNKKYEIKRDCENCYVKTIIKIPRGTTIKEWLEMNRGKCENCGCIIEIEKKEKEKPRESLYDRVQKLKKTLESLEVEKEDE